MNRKEEIKKAIVNLENELETIELREEIDRQYRAIKELKVEIERLKNPLRINPYEPPMWSPPYITTCGDTLKSELKYTLKNIK